MDKVIMLKDIFHVWGGRVTEVMTLSYTYVEDRGLLQGIIDPLEITLYFFEESKDDVLKAAAKTAAKYDAFRYAAIMTDEDGSQTALARGVDEGAAARYAAFATLCDTGVAINPDELAEKLRYEQDGVVWSVLPYKFEYRSLL